MFSRDPLDIEALLSVTSLSLFLSDRVMSGHVPLAAKLMPWGHQGKSLKDKHAPTFPVPAWKRQKDSQVTIPENCFLCWVQKPSATQPPPHSLKMQTLAYLSCLLQRDNTTLKLTVPCGAGSGGRKQ